MHSEASADILLYLSNPVNAFRLTKRLTTDWKEVESHMLDDVGSSESKIYSLFGYIRKLPLFVVIEEPLLELTVWEAIEGAE